MPIGRTSMLPNCVQGTFANEKNAINRPAVAPTPGMSDEAGI